ncbi:hypothetical protein HDU76_004975 [Blyttiomyces sp. JEL0837]|nr:hypothetical protein HDU76_004975 [Blyttiomyces sp. JEL0837]
MNASNFHQLLGQPTTSTTSNNTNISPTRRKPPHHRRYNSDLLQSINITSGSSHLYRYTQHHRDDDIQSDCDHDIESSGAVELTELTGKPLYHYNHHLINTGTGTSTSGGGDVPSSAEELDNIHNVRNMYPIKQSASIPNMSYINHHHHSGTTTPSSTPTQTQTHTQNKAFDYGSGWPSAGLPPRSSSTTTNTTNTTTPCSGGGGGGGSTLRSHHRPTASWSSTTSQQSGIISPSLPPFFTSPQHKNGSQNGSQNVDLLPPAVMARGNSNGQVLRGSSSNDSIDLEEQPMHVKPLIASSTVSMTNWIGNKLTRSISLIQNVASVGSGGVGNGSGSGAFDDGCVVSGNLPPPPVTQSVRKSGAGWGWSVGGFGNGNGGGSAGGGAAAKRSSWIGDGSKKNQYADMETIEIGL